MEESEGLGGDALVLKQTRSVNSEAALWSVTCGVLTRVYCFLFYMLNMYLVSRVKDAT